VPFIKVINPRGAKAYINPEQVDDIGPFNQPGLKKIEDEEWDYELVLVASTFYITLAKWKFLKTRR
jgi:cytochrome c oxidase subunit II